MKAEERKELKQNTLVATLEKVGHNLKEGPSRRTVVVAGIILLVVLLFGLWKWVTSLSAGRNSERYFELFAASSPEDLNTLADKHADTVQGRAARLQRARNQLREGLTEVYSSYETAAKTLRESAETFEKLAGEFRGTPILVQECLYGAAQAYEALGEFDRASALYEDVGKQFKDSLLGQQAEQDAQRVKDNRKDLETLLAELKAKKS